jgi:ATP-dependent Clp protease ATP-binding subunit ClpA
LFERFTERGRQVLVLAQDEARALKHNYIGTEHILLGLLREAEGRAGALALLDISIEDVRAQVARIVGQGDDVTTGQIPFTPRAKKVLELSLREALSLGDKDIDTQHILLGLARENGGVAARILYEMGAAPRTIARVVVEIHPGGVDAPTEYVKRFSGDEPRFKPLPARASGMRVLERRSGQQTLLEGMLAMESVLLGLAAIGIGILIGWLIWG